MATLKIRKSENKILELPLTTQKPIARSLAVFQNGKVYYCPLVHSGEYLDSGVKIRIGDTTYALATQIYNPVTYDSSGRQWSCYGIWSGSRAILYSRNQLVLNGCYLSNATTFALSSSMFSFSCGFLVSDLTENKTIFECYLTSAKRVYLYLNPGSRTMLIVALQTSSSSTTCLKKWSLSLDDSHIVTVSYNNGVWAFNFDGTESTTTNKIPTGNYIIAIGKALDSTRGFAGTLWNVSFSFNGTNGIFRFGD